MKQKQKTPITGVGSDPDNKLVVQKSNPLSVLWRSEFTLAEFKLMDAYLARIDSHKPEQRRVRFEKGEIERILGVKKINISELKERVSHLMHPLIIDDGPRSFRGITLFEEAICEADEDGVWQVDLECTQKAMQYFFNVERLGYYRYKLRCVAKISSRYSYILFLYLEQNRFRKTWEVSVEDLKHLLKCEDVQSYSQFKDFNKLLLKRCQAELNTKTECHFTYEPLKHGRIVTGIRFTLETIPDMIASEIPGQISLFEQGVLETPTYSRNDFLHEAIPEFSEAEFEQILTVLINVPEGKLPYYNMPVTDRNGEPDIEFRRYHYLEERLAAMNVAASKRRISNRFSYFIGMLKKDAGM